MHGSVPPAFVIKSACLVKVIKKCLICRRSPKIHVGDFEVAPEMAVIIAEAMIVGDEVESIIFRKVSGVFATEFLDI